MNTSELIGVYNNRFEILKEELTSLTRKKNIISWVRFIITILMIVAIWCGRSYGWWWFVSVFVVWLAVFLRLVAIAVNNNSAIQHRKFLMEINEQEIAIINGDYKHKPGGEQFAPATHDYANDLDVFGKASIYQYINRTESEQGNAFMAHRLLQPSTVDNIISTQEAVKELAPQMEWRQQLQANGMETTITTAAQQKLEQWLNTPSSFIDNKGWQLLRIAFPTLTLSSLVLHIVGYLSSPVFYFLVAVYLIISWMITKKVMVQYNLLDKMVPQIATLSNSLKTIEQLQAQSSLLQSISDCFLHKSFKASSEVKRLKNILDRFDIRLNPLVFLPLNTFLLWDLHLVFQLEKWKKKNHTQVNKWFEKLGEIEFLSSIANLHFNYKSWAFPVFTEEHGTFTAKDLGHILIPQNKRVASDFSIHGIPQLALVTGSNMAGKSTFLRSVGTNIVLAMMGAPVCASACKLAPMRVVSTMRVADNLDESTSTFYAELKKLQYIIEAVNRKEKVFLLFDEILRGTNSADRHLGSEALIKQLMHQGATGILATHDLELTRLANEMTGMISNYHFDMQLKNNSELYFDYKLKDGICKSMNATFLMKMIGIEMI